MDRPLTPHRIVNPPTALPAVGFSHAVVAERGRTVWVAGQTAHDGEGVLHGATLAEQFDRAAANLVAALAACDARPEHLVWLQIFTTDVAGYRAVLGPLGTAWRRHLGRHFPAVSLLGVTELFDPAALVELVAVAVVTDPHTEPRQAVSGTARGR